MDDEEKNESWFSYKIIIGIMIGYSLCLYYNPTKYQGLTAAEWYDEYDTRDAQYQTISDEYNTLNDEHESLVDCIDDYAYSSDYDELSKIYYMCL